MLTIDIPELKPKSFGADEFDHDLALAAEATKLVDVEYPNYGNGQKYVLRSKSCIGLIRLASDRMLRILPKVPVKNLFGMMEVVHRLPSLRFDPGIANVESVEDIYVRIVNLFVSHVTRRIRQGLRAAYVEVDGETTVVRGRIDVACTVALQCRGSPAVHCRYQVQTLDIDDNRILLWTLDRIPRLGLIEGEDMARVHAARRALMGTVQLVEMTARDCQNRTYDRLNADYQTLHALARFLLEHTGPGIAAGQHAFVPFTVNMAHLFQEYVVACLRRHAPPGISVTPQYHVEFDAEVDAHFDIDVVLTDTRTGAAVGVVEAKYKADEKTRSADIRQAVAYAALTDAPAAFLVYPYEFAPIQKPVGPAGRIELTRLGMALELNLQEQAEKFAGQVFSRVRSSREAARTPSR